MTVSNQSSSKDISDKLDWIIKEIQTISPMPRRLSQRDISTLIEMATMYPAKFRINYEQNDVEGYGLATQIADALTKAKWTLTQPVAPVIVGGANAPLFGIEVDFNGPPSQPNEMVQIPKATPQGATSVVLSSIFPEEFHVRRFPDLSADTIQIMIYANPKTKPQ